MLVWRAEDNSFKKALLFKFFGLVVYMYIITSIITLRFFISCYPKNTLICKLDFVDIYIAFNEKTHLWLFYTHFAERKSIFFLLLKVFSQPFLLYKITNNNTLMQTHHRKIKWL